MDELLLFTLSSPSLHFRWTGSFLQFLSTSSSLNSDGRAPTIHIDEPFTAYQTDGLLPTNLIDELSPQLRWTGSFLQFLLTSSSINSDGRAPTIHIDEPFMAPQIDGLLPTIHKHELFPTALPDELFPTALPDELFPTALPDELFPTTLSDELQPHSLGTQLVQAKYYTKFQCCSLNC